MFSVFVSVISVCKLLIVPVWCEAAVVYNDKEVTEYIHRYWSETMT